MQVTSEIRTSLKREYSLCSNALVFYKKTVRQFEKKHRLSTQKFLKQFEAGTLGDDAEYFDWYAHARLLSQWQKTLSAIRTAVR